jgi:hypothetical protein
LGSLIERNRIVATLSDGREIERFAEVSYVPGEREHLIESMARPAGGPDGARAVRLARAILDRRARSVERVRGELQREYGGGVFADA